VIHSEFDQFYPDIYHGREVPGSTRTILNEKAAIVDVPQMPEVQQPKSTSTYPQQHQ
jgi:hypothetical protein